MEPDGLVQAFSLGPSAYARTMGEFSKLEVPLRLRRGGRRGDEEWTAAALGLLDLLATSTGRPDLSDASVLDVGCGNKFTAAIVNEDVSIRRYVGVDTDEEVIRFLIEEVDDPRLTFHFLNAHNELYNPAGRPLDSFGRLPVGDERFDIICLFSVFTHLAPHDYRAMLELLRPHVAPEGRLVFSLFVDQGATPEQREAIDADLRRRVEAGDTELMKEIERRVAAGGVAPDFVDRIPEKPLLEAVYSEPYARELIEGSGWEALELHAPVRPIVQHYFICRPV